MKFKNIFLNKIWIKEETKNKCCFIHLSFLMGFDVILNLKNYL